MTDVNELVDLGTATVETKGGPGIFSDDKLQQDVAGLSND